MDTKTILAHLITNDSYHNQVIEHIDPKFFEELEERELFACMKDYATQYKKMATKEAMMVALGTTTLNDEGHKKVIHLLSSLMADPKTSTEWLVDETEKWGRARSQYHAMMNMLKVAKSEKGGDIATVLIAADAFSFKPKNICEHFMKFEVRKQKRNPIISGMMSPQDVTLFVGQPGSFKSFIALLMLLCTATGRDFGGHKCQKGAAVLFVGEGDEGMQDRVIALCAEYGIDWNDIPIEIISINDKRNNCPQYDADSKDSNKARADWLKIHVDTVSEKYGIKVNHIAFDTFRTAINNIDENAAKHVTPAILHFKEIAKDNDTAVSVFHHTNRELKDFSGSGSFKSDCDNLYFIEAVEGMTAILTRNDHRGKQKDFGMLDDIQFKMVVHETGQYENGDTVTSLAATVDDGPREDVVLTLVKAHYAGGKGPLLKSDLLKSFKDGQKGTGTDDALNKRFREKHFKPLLNVHLDYVPSTYIGNAKEDGIVTLRTGDYVLGIAAE
jgi:hypothetical protein